MQNICENLSIAIPTYGRELILTATIRLLLDLEPRAAEILVIDQTRQHTDSVEQQLADWDRTAAIRWLRLPEPSIPVAMNSGLTEARNPLVLFLDDDIIPTLHLVRHHAAAHDDSDVWAVVGQVLQPGQEPLDVPVRCVREGLRADLDFPFYSTEAMDVQNVMAGNLSVKRDQALAVGGFDERFVGAAYRFETEFARRVIRAGGRIRYCPQASIRHLRATVGGTRATGSHLTSANPVHGVGDYYFAMLHGRRLEAAGYMARRMVREVSTRFHLRHPWWIPVKLLGEMRALAWAWRLTGGGGTVGR